MTFFQTFPAKEKVRESIFGMYPTDFLIEHFLEAGLKWFRETPEAPTLVYGHLARPEIAGRYGKEKIEEIAAYVRDHEVKIIQSFPQDDSTFPTISINLQEGIEEVAQAGLGDFAGQVDALSSIGAITSRTELGYVPFQDSVLVGIHAAGSPDKVKYLAYLVTYILASTRKQFERLGLYGLTFRATDLSRLSEFLPANVFSRFVTVQVGSKALVKAGEIPVLETVEVTVSAE